MADISEKVWIDSLESNRKDQRHFSVCFLFGEEQTLPTPDHRYPRVTQTT